MSQVPKAKMNIPMCTACILLCLTLFSMYLTGGLYSKYVSRDNSDETARVATFSVGLSTTTDGVDIKLGQNQTDGSYNFTDTNKSEVAVKYDVVLTFENALPSYVTVTLNGAVGTKPDGAGNKLLFKNVANLAPNGAAAENVIVFAVNSIDAFSSDAKSDIDASSDKHKFEANFYASVKCEQID